MTDPNALLDEIARNQRQVLKYSRHRFLGTWLAVALMSILIALALWLSVDTAHRQNQTAHLTASSAKQQAKGAQESSDQIVLYLQGKQGIPGVPGANGKPGTPGQPGSVPADLPPGPAGPKGDRGATGSSGTAGATGPPGAAGATGAIGPAGPSGEAGPAGSTGENGATGDAGDKGDKGAKGDKGDAGSQGPAGAQGPPGPQGPSGLTKVQTVIAANGPDPTQGNRSAMAHCPAGTLPLGGGFDTSPTTIQIITLLSIPSSDGWDVVATTNGLAAGTAWTLLAYAICGS